MLSDVEKILWYKNWAIRGQYLDSPISSRSTRIKAQQDVTRVLTPGATLQS